MYKIFLFSCTAALHSSVFFIGEGLYWQAHENGLEFAIESEEKTSHFKSVEFDQNLGFRIGIGGNLAFDKWDIALIWTHFHTTAKGKEEGTLFPLWTDTSAIKEEAKGRWRLHLGFIDAELAKEFCVSRWVFIRPLLGVRASVVRQKYYVRYGEEDAIGMKNKFFGIGPRVGLKSRFNLGDCFDLFAEAAFSLNTGQFYIHESEKEDDVPQYKVFNRFHLIRAFAEIKGGIEFKTQYVNLAAAYEQHLLFGQNQLVRFMQGSIAGVSVSNLGDLTLQGFTLAAKFEF